MTDAKGLDETEHLSESFQVTTTNREHEFIIATDYKFMFPKSGYNQVEDTLLLVVYGDDDFEDGPIQLRAFNMDYVVDYGWAE